MGDAFYLMDDRRTVSGGSMAPLAADQALKQRYLGVEDMSAVSSDDGAWSFPRSRCSWRRPVVEPRAWLTLGVAGLAMGMLVFLVPRDSP